MDKKISKFEGKSLPFKQYFWGAVILNLIIILGGLTIQKFLPPVTPLFYGLAEEGQLAPKPLYFLPVGVSLLILAINGVASVKIQDEFLKKVLIWGAVTSTLLTAITSIKIALLIGSF